MPLNRILLALGVIGTFSFSALAAVEREGTTPSGTDPAPVVEPAEEKGDEAETGSEPRPIDDGVVGSDGEGTEPIEADPAPTDSPAGKEGEASETVVAMDTIDGEVVGSDGEGGTGISAGHPFDIESIPEESMDTKWQRFVAGVRGISRYSLWDDKVKLRVGARIQADGTAGSATDGVEAIVGPIDSSFNVRRLNVYTEGRVKDMKFRVAWEFGADWGFDAAWLEGIKGGLSVWGHDLGKLRFGFLQEPFGLERSSSSYDLSVIERSLPLQTIGPGSNLGAMVYGMGKKGRMTWAFGLFSFGKSNEENASTSALSLTTRWTGLPLYRDQGRKLIHVGASFSSRSPTGDDTQYRSRPEARFVEFFADTGSMQTSGTVLLGVDAMAVSGPFWLQAEYVSSRLDSQLLGDPTFGGGYIQFGYFITGQSLPYLRRRGIIARLVPESYKKGSPFRRRNGGAWEVVGRVSTIDLNDALISGGELRNFTAGLNWYISGTTRVMLNYVHSKVLDVGSADIAILRLQFRPW